MSLRLAGAQVHEAVVDVSDLSAMRAVWGGLPPSFQDIDLAIANAGVSSITEGPTLDVDECRRIMEVNYFGSMNVAALALPRMLERKMGRLVVVSSLAGWRGLPGSCAYGASKAAQQIFFEGLRVDLKKTGVKVTTVFPGFVDTPINKPLHERYELPFMIAPEDAAGRILAGIARRKSQIVFPLASYLMGLVSKVLPNKIYDVIIRVNLYGKKQEPKELPRAE